MKLFSCLIPAMVLALAGSAAASPVTVTFEDVSNGTVSANVNSAGYNFQGRVLYYSNGAACSPACAANGTRTLLAAGPNWGYANTITMTRDDGGTFVLTGFDAGEMFSSRETFWAATQLNYVGTLGGTTVTSGALDLDQLLDGPGGIDDFQHFAIDGALVDTFVFSGIGGRNGNGGFSLDNLAVQDAVVPEPGTLTLAGLALLGLARSRRRKA